ncbi:MAG: hypothetical protein ABIS38_05060 [Sphingomicrobium sp.]
MSPSLRFLFVAVVAWTGVRAASLGVMPAGSLLSAKPREARTPPPIVATEFPPIEPLPAAPPEVPAQDIISAAYSPGQATVALPPVTVRRIAVPVYYAAASSIPDRPTRLRGALPEPEPAFYSPIPALNQWPLARIAAASLPVQRSSVIGTGGQSLPVAAAVRGRAKLDRLQVTSWALLRGRQGQPIGTTSLAANGTLGASQAGARLNYNINRQLAASLRSSSNVGRRGGELAAGVRLQPVGGLPLWITAERRLRLGRYGGGRNAFALFVEGGVYQRPMPWHFSLDAYFQGGIVGLKSRDKFVDGGLTLTRPLYRNFSGGVGLWGAAQPGIYRVDAGPRVSMKVRDNIRVHLDWRQRLAGKAEPGSGPAVTLAGDF